MEKKAVLNTRKKKKEKSHARRERKRRLTGTRKGNIQAGEQEPSFPNGRQHFREKKEHFCAEKRGC